MEWGKDGQVGGLGQGRGRFDGDAHQIPTPFLGDSAQDTVRAAQPLCASAG